MEYDVVGIDLGNEHCCLILGKFIFAKPIHRVRKFSNAWPKNTQYDYIAINLRRRISQIKRLLGWKFSDPELQMELGFIPFRVTEGPDGYPVVHGRYKGEDKTFTPVEILALLISLLVSQARESYFPRSHFPELERIQFCISVPTYFSDSQRAGVREAANIAGLSVTLLDETLAMVQAYEQYWSFVPIMGRYIVAFVDVGLASIQVCFAEFKDCIWVLPNADVLYRGYVRSLGGRDFDRELFKHFASKIRHEYNINIYESSDACIRLMKACEGLKKNLSIKNESSFCIKNFCGLEEFKGLVKRKDFEKLCSPILKKIEMALQKALSNSGLKTEEVDYVEAVGNGYSIPGISDILTKTFGREARKMKCSCEYFARGCAAEAKRMYFMQLVFQMEGKKDAGRPSVELVSSAPTEDARKEFLNWKRAMDAGGPSFIFLNDFLEEIVTTEYLHTTESKKMHNELEYVSQHISEIEVELAKARTTVSQSIPVRDNAGEKAEELCQEGTQHVGYFAEFSYLELQDATNNFHESFKLGEGGFGIVYKGILRNTTAAIKILKEGSNLGVKEFYQEVEILSKVQHPNLVMLIGACVETHALIYEYLPNGSLEDRLKCKNNTPPLSWQTRVRIAFEICSALSFLHSIKPHGIVHGDLKPDNILLDENYTSKICDFGLCRQLNWTDSASIPYHWTDCPKGTLGYMDPEFFSMGKITPQYDVYSFGIILLRLVTCKDPWGIRNMVEEAQQKGVLKTLVDGSAGPWPFKEAKKMISLGLRCSDPIRKNRPDLSIKVMKEITFMLEVASTSLSTVSLFSRFVHL